MYLLKYTIYTILPMGDYTSYTYQNFYLPIIFFSRVLK